MFGIGIPEFILILIVGLIVFGPSKLPEVGRAVGKGLREFKKASSALQATLNAPDDDPPPKRQSQPPAEIAAKSDDKPIKPKTNEPSYIPPTQESVREELARQQKADSFATAETNKTVKIDEDKREE